MLRHLYNSAPALLEALLVEFFDDAISIGLEFTQQIKSGDSVPDGNIVQKPLEILVETKLGGELDEDQIARHIAGKPGVYMLGLTKDPIEAGARDRLTKIASGKAAYFSAITFSDLLRMMRNGGVERDPALSEIVDSYEEFLEKSNLLAQGPRLLVRPTRRSMEANEKYNFYAEPLSQPDRSQAEYFGLYADKTVKFIGMIRSVFVAKWDRGKFVLVSPKNDGFKESDLEEIKKATDNVAFYNDLKDQEPHRFYFVDKFHETELKKTSPYGIWRAKYLVLEDILGFDCVGMKTSDIAENLVGKSFE